MSNFVSPPAESAPSRDSAVSRSTPPRRIQRKRTNGWRMPADAVYVGRPTKWGNPFKVTDDRDYFEATFMYADWLELNPEGQKIAALARIELRGKDLACWCPIWQACHAKVLLSVANGVDPENDLACSHNTVAEAKSGGESKEE